MPLSSGESGELPEGGESQSDESGAPLDSAAPTARARRARIAALRLLGVALVPFACTNAVSPTSPISPAASTADSASASARPLSAGLVEVHLLYTSDEHGWVAGVTEKGRTRGGSAALLARWKRDEGHCVPTPNDRCESSTTLALSGGDNWTGPALSSYFQGEVAAEAMGRLGYAASALGNHELDFGQAIFARNNKIAGFPYLAANVTPSLKDGGLVEATRTFTRAGIKIAVIGLSTHDTPVHGMRSNYTGMRFDDEATTLEREVPAAYAAGADAVVVIAHVCANDLDPIVKAHPTWKLAFVGAGHCHRLDRHDVGGTPLVEPGSFLHGYIRVTVKVDTSRARGDRVVSSTAENVDLTYPEGSQPPIAPDPDLAAIVGKWQAKADAALGEVIGHTSTSIEPESPMMGNLITDAWRTATKSDVALLNKYATRQAIPTGPVSLQSIYSVMPFDNKLVTVKLNGAQLLENVHCCGGHVSGLRRATTGKKDLTTLDGKPIDPARIYTVTVTDYAYFGGSGSTTGTYDTAGVFGPDWREPVVNAIRGMKSTAQHGIDQVIDKSARP